MGESSNACTVRLRALSGRPLRDARIKGMVVSCAHAIAERNRVRVLELEASDQSLTLRLACDRLAALGLMMELRRTTNAWYEGKFQAGPLWGTAPDEHVPAPEDD